MKEKRILDLNNHILYEQVINQINDSTQTIQDTTHGVNFGSLQNQSMLSVDVADTVEPTTVVPTQLITRVKTKKVHKPDTLNYYVEYLRYLDSVGYKQPEIPKLDNFCFKENLYVKYDGLIIKKRERSYPKKELFDNKKQHKSAKEVIVKQQKTKKKQTFVAHKEHSKETNKSINASNIDYKIPDWLTGVIVVSLVLFAFTRLAFRKKFSELLNSILNYRYAASLFKERNIIHQRTSQFLNVIFITNLSVSLFLLAQYTSYKNSADFTFLFKIFVSVLAFYLSKSLIIYFLGKIFKNEEIAREVNFSMWLYNKALGISLFVVVFSLPFIKPELKQLVIYLTFLALVTFLLLRYYRYLQIVIRIKLSIFYWILYLCTLEILPLLILVKLL